MKLHETAAAIQQLLNEAQRSIKREDDRDIEAEILAGNPRVLKEPAAGIGISVLADSSISISVKPWTSVDDFGPAGGEINKAIVETFRGRNIVIPFPQREVRMLA